MNMATETNPRFSVIIPTKDRAEYLRHTLRTCTLQDYDNLEVIVSDDGSEDSTREVVESATRKDPRIRYVSPGGCVGMRDNFEFALNQVKPGFVIALGGDDGLLPYGIQGMLEMLNETRQELLAWPSPLFSYPFARGATGQVAIYWNQKTKIIESEGFLRRQAQHLHYLSDIESPMFYVKGVTSTRLVDRVRSRSADGRFYSCPTPDGYSGIVLAGEVPSYAFSGRPFAMYGLSPTSQGLGYLAGNEQAKKRSEAFYQAVAKTPMHPELASQPYSPLITLMTADYLLSARDLPGWPGPAPEIDFRRLLMKGIKELSHGLYANDRIARELNILNTIAESKGLGEFFRKAVVRAKRYKEKPFFEGNGISPAMVFLDGAQYGVHTILDAAYMVHSLFNFFTKTTLLSTLKMLGNSLSYRMQSLRSGGSFPEIPEQALNGSDLHWPLLTKPPVQGGRRGGQPKDLNQRD